MTLIRSAVLVLSACTTTVQVPKDDTGPPDSPAPETGEPEDSPPPDSDSAATRWPALRINELMASNQATVQDATGAWSDWIELLNPTDATVDLTGWTITDTLTEPDRHTLGALSIQPGEHLLLWADKETDLGLDHLSFALDEEGEATGLFAPDGTAIDGLRFEDQAEDISLGRVPDGGDTWTLCSPATPGASNGG